MTIIERPGDQPSTRPGACVAELLCDRHDPSTTAFTLVDDDENTTLLTFGELADRSARLAAGLAELGVGRGDRVATIMSKGADLITTQLAVFRLGAVYLPLFTAFNAGALADRLHQATPKVVVCDGGQRPKLEHLVRPGPESLWPIVNSDADPSAGDVPFADLLDGAALSAPVAVGPDATMLLLYTSGTTGKPKGVTVPVRALASFAVYLTYGLGLTEDDVYWNMGDPGWAYGLYYAILAPLLTGRCSMLVAGKFTAARTWQVLSRHGVTNLTAAPTVFRALRASRRTVGTLQLRRVSSAGEPLNADVVEWSRRELGVAVHDHYGQTELGMVLGNLHHPAVAAEITPGSMGRAVPGWAVAVLAADRDEEAACGELGRLAIDVSHSASMWFEGYVDRPDATAERFTADHRWYLTGDVARRDEDGRFYFASRDDDLILMAGYRIGPFDIESVILGHEFVAEAACVGVADELRGEVIEAFVVLRDEVEPSVELAEELQTLVKEGYAAYAYPRRVHFLAALPKTPSGKVQRTLLRQRAQAAR